MSLFSFLKSLNRERLIARKAKKFKKFDISAKPSRNPPQKIRNIIILHFLPGWGDFLYFAGLIKCLEQCNINVSIGTSTKLVNRFQRISSTPVLDVTLGDIPSHVPDCILDLDWSVGKHHEFTFLQNINCWCITCSNVLSKLNLFDQYINISKISHISKRYKFVAETITHQPCITIYPFIPISHEESWFSKIFLQRNNLNEKKFVYLNTVGSDKDRQFSIHQILEIIEVLLSKNIPTVFFSPNFNIASHYPDRKNLLISAPDANFFKISAIVSKAKAIISPDTSIVHLASAFKIPVMAVYCKNDYDFFGNHLLSEVWGPLSKNSSIIDPSDKKKIFSKFTPISSLDLDFKVLTLKFLSEIFPD